MSQRKILTRTRKQNPTVKPLHMYVCIHIFIYIYIDIDIYIYIHLCVYVNTHTYIYIYIYILHYIAFTPHTLKPHTYRPTDRRQTVMHTYIPTHLPTYLPAYLPARLLTCLPAYLQTNRFVQTYTCMDFNTYAAGLRRFDLHLRSSTLFILWLASLRQKAQPTGPESLLSTPQS